MSLVFREISNRIRHNKSVFEHIFERCVCMTMDPELRFFSSTLDQSVTEDLSFNALHRQKVTTVDLSFSVSDDPQIACGLHRPEHYRRPELQCAPQAKK